MQCPACRASNPDDARWCTLCFAPFPVSLAPVAAMAASPRPDEASGSEAFARTASVTLTGDGIHAWADALLAGDSLHRLDERHTCLDLHDNMLFYVERYRAVPELAFTVFDPSGTPLATYLSSDDLLDREVVVRDGTSAPVATMRAVADHRLDLFDTGGEHLGFCWHEECDLITVIDDRWGLVMLEAPHALDRRAIVAAPLVCRLISHRRPRPKPRHRDGHEWMGLTLESGS